MTNEEGGPRDIASNHIADGIGLNFQEGVCTIEL